MQVSFYNFPFEKGFHYFKKWILYQTIAIARRGKPHTKILLKPIEKHLYKTMKNTEKRKD
jgi:hypothetical protein